MGAAAQLLKFDEATHSYTWDGVPVPGVTEVLRPFVDFSRIDPRVLAAKADLGRRVHVACQFDDENDLDETSVEDDVAPYLAAYRKFRTDTGAIVIANERKVFEPLFRYAGTLDRILAIANDHWLVDLKTAFTTPMSAGPQTAAYQRANADFTINRRAALRLRPDGTYRFDPLNNPDDWSAFLACLTVHRFKEVHSHE